MVCEYHLEYVGRFDVPSPATSSETQVETVDNIVAKLRENQKNGSKGKPKRRSLTAMFKNIGKQSASSGRDSDSVDGMAASNSASSLLGEDDGLVFATNGHSASCTSLHSQEEDGEGSCTDVSVVVTSASPVENLTSPIDVHRPMSQTDGDIRTIVTNGCEKEANSSPNSRRVDRRELGEEEGERVADGTKAAAGNGVVETASPQSSKENGRELDDGGGGKAVRTFSRMASDSVSSSFDTLPELATLKDTYAFQALSQNQKVKLVFSGLTVAMLSEQGGEQLLNLHVRNISCCAQVREGEGRRGMEGRRGREGRRGMEGMGVMESEGRMEGKRGMEGRREKKSISNK